MMNNHGWGLRDMIIFSSIIIIALALVYMLIINLYKELEGPQESPSYTSIEKSLVNAAKKYFSIRIHSDSNMVVSDELIDEKLITEKSLTLNGDVCTGYVLKEDTLKAFISCDKYETEGY